MSIFQNLFGGGSRCNACHKKIRRFSVPGGRWSGTIDQLPRIEPDHAFVCEKCGAKVCPVCSGKRAGELGMKALVCTECGHSPLKTIYR